jgi:microcystin-dependent protein
MKIKALCLILIALLLGAASVHAQDSPYIGEIVLVPYNFAPVGFMECDGQLLPIAQYAALFSILGTTYGGNGTSNFALPNLNNSVVIGAGQGPGLSLYDLGQSGGSETVTLLESQIPAHTHLISADSSAGTMVSPSGNVPAAHPAGVPMYASAPDRSTTSSVVVGSTGGSQPHNNMMPYVGLKYIIAINGVFPARGIAPPAAAHK